MKNSFSLKFFILLSYIFLNTHFLYAQNDTTLAKIYFSTNQYMLTEASKNVLKDFIVKYKDNKSLQLAGRCDNHGDDALNDSLSFNRAVAVRDFLITNGFPTEKIGMVAGLGKRMPVETGSVYTDSLNRVVWITVPVDVVTNTDNTKKINAFSIHDSLVMVLKPDWSQYTVLNGSPHKGDTLRIDTSLNQVSDTLFVSRKLYIASDTAQLVFSLVPKEIPEKTKKSALNQAFMDSIQNSNPGQAIVIRCLNFEFGYHVMPKTDQPALQAVLSALKAMPHLKLDIRGHVCCSVIGNELYDVQTSQYDLSLNRAKEVYDYLVTNGADASRLSYAGYKMKNPLVYPEKGKNDQYKNRRIEFVILDK